MISKLFSYSKTCFVCTDNISRISNSFSNSNIYDEFMIVSFSSLFSIE